jgi:hypothetical protein
VQSIRPTGASLEDVFIARIREAAPAGTPAEPRP